MNGTIDYTVLDNEQLAKLEAGPRANVLFKPSKKMKKRRQLDALVSNGKKLPRRKNSGHELLRSNDDSDSSEVEEFSVLESHKWGRRWPSSSCCSVSCSTLAGLLLAVMAIMAGGGLLWMNLALRQTCNQLQERLTAVEKQNADVPEEMQSLQTRLLTVNKSLSILRSSPGGTDELNKNLLSLKTQVSSLMSTTADLQKAVKGSTPDDNKEQVAVANTVADLGADLQKMHTDLQTLDTSHNSLSSQVQAIDTRVTALENPGGREGLASSSIGTMEVSENPGGREAGLSSSSFADLEALVTDINTTFSHSMALAMEAITRHQVQLSAVDQFSQSLSTQLSEVRQTLDTLTPGQLQNNRTQSEAGQTEALSEVMKDHQEFLQFKADVISSLQDVGQTQAEVNTTVWILNGDVHDLYSRVGQAMDHITNITQLMSSLLTPTTPPAHTAPTPVSSSSNTTKPLSEGVNDNNINQSTVNPTGNKEKISDSAGSEVNKSSSDNKEPSSSADKGQSDNAGGKGPHGAIFKDGQKQPAEDGSSENSKTASLDHQALGVMNDDSKKHSQNGAM